MSSPSAASPSRSHGREHQSASYKRSQIFGHISAEDMMKYLDSLPEPRQLPASWNKEDEVQGEATSPMRLLDRLSAATGEGPWLTREMADELVRELQPSVDIPASSHILRIRTGKRKPRIARSTPIASPTSSRWPLLVPASGITTQPKSETRPTKAMQPRVSSRHDNTPVPSGPGAGPLGYDADPRRQRQPTNEPRQASQTQQKEQLQPNRLSKPVQAAVFLQKSSTDIVQLQVGVLLEKRKISKTEDASQKCTEAVQLMNQGASDSDITGRLGIDSDTLLMWKKTLAYAGCPVGSMGRNELMTQQYEFLVKSSRTPYSNAQFRAIIELLEQGMPRREVSRLTNVPAGTLATYKRRLQEAGLPVRPKALTGFAAESMGNSK